MLTLKYLLNNGEKIGLKQLGKLLSAGMTELQTIEEKKEFGMQAMKLYDRKHDDEIDKYLKNGTEAKYYSNLIQRDENTILKNIVWNPKVETPIHGHNCQGCWVLCLEGELVENIYDNQEGEPQIISTKILRPGAVTYMHDSIGFHTL